MTKLRRREEGIQGTGKDRPWLLPLLHILLISNLEPEVKVEADLTDLSSLRHLFLAQASSRAAQIRKGKGIDGNSELNLFEFAKSLTIVLVQLVRKERTTMKRYNMCTLRKGM